jgi:hypothetical protein
VRPDEDAARLGLRDPVASRSKELASS